MLVKSNASATRDKRTAKEANNKLIIPLVCAIIIAVIIAGYFAINMVGSVSAESRALSGPSQTLLDRYNATLPKQYTPYGKPPRPGEVRPPMGTFPPAGMPSSQGKPFNPYN